MSSTIIEAATRPDAASPLTTCGCGQALDVCRSGHCPRCGVTLRH